MKNYKKSNIVCLNLHKKYQSICFLAFVHPYFKIYQTHTSVNVIFISNLLINEKLINIRHYNTTCISCGKKYKNFYKRFIFLYINLSWYYKIIPVFHSANLLTPQSFFHLYPFQYLKYSLSFIWKIIKVTKFYWCWEV